MGTVKPGTVDEYVKARVSPEFRSAVAEVRRVMKGLAPKVQEVFAYGMPCYKGRHILAYMMAGKKGVTLGFTRGKLMQDRYGRLKGSAKWARNLLLRSKADVDPAAIRYYARQALALDAE